LMALAMLDAMLETMPGIDMSLRRSCPPGPSRSRRLRPTSIGEAPIAAARPAMPARASVTGPTAGATRARAP
jgi:hypothetical protein